MKKGMLTVLFFYAVVIVGILASFLMSDCFPSPKDGLLKVDARDWYFAHQHDYAINQVEYVQIAKGSEFWGLWCDLQKQIKKHERGKKCQ